MKKVIIVVLTFGVLSSCGGTMQSPFATSSNATKMSLGTLCSRYVNNRPTDNWHKYAKEELHRRGIKPSECFSVVER